MCGYIAQLVEHRTGIAEVTGSNPVEALIFFRLHLSNCLNWKIYCGDHSSLSMIIKVNGNYSLILKYAISGEMLSLKVISTKMIWQSLYIYQTPLQQKF